MNNFTDYMDMHLITFGIIMFSHGMAYILLNYCNHYLAFCFLIYIDLSFNARHPINPNKCFPIKVKKGGKDQESKQSSTCLSTNQYQNELPSIG